MDPVSNSPTGKIFILCLSQVFLWIPVNLPFLFLMKGHLWLSSLVPQWSQYKLLLGTVAFLCVIFFAKEQVTISFPSSNIVMSNHCFLSTLGKAEKFLYTCLKEKVCQEQENI